MNDVTTIFQPMPAMTCPDWCQVDDHEQHWQNHFRNLHRAVTIPMQDGTVEVVGGADPERIAETWEPLHTRTLYALGLPDGDPCVSLVLQDDGEGGVVLYLDAEGPLTGEQARTLADAFREAAVTLVAAQ